MVKLTRIYTRGGDRGQTSLGDGARVDKHDLRVAAYGTVDEANAVIGVARLHAPAGDPEVDAQLARIQNDLFDVGADLCRPGDGTDDKLRVAERLVSQLAGREAINPAALKYLNRLSDHLFVLARWVNDRGARDVLWVPGANR
ncbi:MAG: ATP:cob(I)alamin adenosyltransferase [Proteobacteria bacterium]|nr:ATP:cob(I)alamin adenosyltransferase [Pseudomonadota bacterium]